MSYFLQKIQQNMMLNTKDKIRNRQLVFKLVCLIITVLLMVGIPNDEISAASGLRIYNYTTKKTTTYTDKQIKVTLNGKQISKNNTPGILENGIALVSYKDIFVNSPIKAEYDYNKAKGTVTISKFGTTIVMKLNSKTAQVNGKSVTMPVAPVKIKYISADVTKILVPSRFVSETLGLDYTWHSSKSTVAIESKAMEEGMPLSYDDGDKFYYTGTLGKVIVEGEVISLGNMPSIINNNTAMLRAKRVFADSPIGAKYKYDSKTKNITLTRGDTEVVMKIGSKTAYVNGKTQTLDRAPMIVYNHDAKTSYVMVPGRNTASFLGYDYQWDKDTFTSIFTTRVNEKPEDSNENNNDKPTPEPELGDSGMNNTGLILNEWKVDRNLLATSSDLHTLNQGSTLGNDGIIYDVARDYSNMKLNAETYVISATTAYGEVSSTRNGNTITIRTNKPGNGYTYSIYGNTGIYVNEIRTGNQPDKEGTTIEIDVIPEQYTYDIILSPDHMHLYVTVYTNGLQALTIGTNDSCDFINLSGLSPLEVDIKQESGLLYVDIPYTYNGIGDQNVSILGAKYLNLAYAIRLMDKTQLVFGMKEGGSYYTYKEGNQFIITLQDPNTNPTPVQPSQPDTPSNPEPPTNIDVSKYQIIIPKPAGITKTQLSDKDDYYNNRFYITIPGDHTSYINKSNIINKASAVKGITVTRNGKNDTVIQVNTTKLQGYTYVTDDNNIYVKVGNPRDIYPNIVILDPGHGGPANGAQYFNTKEKDLNLKILYTLGEKYFNSDPSRLKVYYTRESDVDMALRDRAAYADKMGADLFVSLHMNASTASSAYGTEVYYSNNNNKNNKAGLNSKTLATIFVNNLTSELGTLNRGAKAESYTVVYRNTVPAVLIELGFLSNKNDFAKISDPVFQERAVKVIYETLLDVFKQYPTGR